MANRNPLVTILIPTYKRTELLKQAIESVLSQSYKNLQLVILDNASMDETGQIVKHFMDTDKRVVLVENEMNIGVNANFRKSFNYIKGEYFCWLCSDDMMPPGNLEKQVDFLIEHPDIPLVAGTNQVIDKNNNITTPPLVYPQESIVSVRPELDRFLGRRRCWMFSIDGILFRTDYVLCNRIDIGNYLNMDAYFQAEMLLYTENIGFINEPSVIRRYHTEHFDERNINVYFLSWVQMHYQVYEFINRFEYLLMHKGYPVEKYKFKLFIIFCKASLGADRNLSVFCERIAGKLLFDIIHQNIISIFLVPFKIAFTLFYPAYRKYIKK